MPKRRRVDLSLRLEEAQAAILALGDVLALELRPEDLAGDPAAYLSRLERVREKLQLGVTYVLEVNPSRRSA